MIIIKPNCCSWMIEFRNFPPTWLIVYPLHLPFKPKRKRLCVVSTYSVSISPYKGPSIRFPYLGPLSPLSLMLSSHSDPYVFGVSAGLDSYTPERWDNSIFSQLDQRQMPVSQRQRIILYPNCFVCRTERNIFTLKPVISYISCSFEIISFLVGHVTFLFIHTIL